MAAASPDSDPSDRFAEAEQGRSGTPKVIRSATDQDDFDRSFIAKSIIWIYGGSVAVGFLIITDRSVLLAFQHNDDWANIVSDASDLIKTNVLPIVTLVLGYYFGRSKR